jgi:hypothetical protein
MSWLYSRALVEEYSAATSSDGEPSAPLSGNPTQLAYLPPDRMTAFSRLSRFGMTFKPLTENLGQDVLTLYLEDFPVRTFLPLDEVQASKEPDRECGVTWRESLAKYDQDTFTWKIPQSSLLEDSTEFLGTWPRWGSMRDGVSYRQPTLALRTKEIGSGLWPTPRAQEPARTTKGYGRGLKELIEGRQQIEKWPTPTAHNAKETNAPSESQRNTPTLAAQAGGTLNPTWVEWLMGWPLGWTDLKPLEMDKYLLWQQQHGGS